jgi:hypothetical protein
VPEAARNPKYDGRIVLLPNVAEVRAGDILLTFNAESQDRKGSKGSKLIRAATRGTFSHAMICSVPPTFVEAVGAGVSTISLQRCFAHRWQNVRLLRFPDANIAANAAKLAQFEVGRDYSVPRAIASVFPQDVVEKIKDKGIFCSALVAQVFAAAGAEAFKEFAIEKTTPATIERMDCLLDITRRVFVESLAPSNIEEMSALDGDRVPSLAGRQTEINNRYANALGPIADRFASTYPEAGLTPPITFFQVLQFIMSANDRISIIAQKRRATFLRDLAALDQKGAELLESGELQEVFSEINAADQKTDQRNLEESFQAHPDIDLRAMHNYRRTARTQLEQRKQAVEEFREWGLQRSRALAAYVAIQHETLEPYERRIALLDEILDRIG